MFTLSDRFLYLTCFSLEIHPRLDDGSHFVVFVHHTLVLEVVLECNQGRKTLDRLLEDFALGFQIEISHVELSVTFLSDACPE